MGKYKGYGEYRESGVEWVGNVPKGWSVESLKYSFNIFNGSTPKSEVRDYWDGNITWVTPADLSRISGKYIKKSQRTITEKGWNSCGTTIVPPESLILSSRAPIGSLAISGDDLCTNQGCKSLVAITPDKTSAVFYYYYLSVSTRQLNLIGRGTTFLELSTDDLGRFKLPVPSAVEQVQIAKFLDHENAKIDTLISKQERLIGLLQEKRQAVISHAVTKGLDGSVGMKDSGVEWLGEVPEHWRMVPLKHLCSFTGGGTPSKDNLSFWTDGTVPWVSPKDMKRFWLDSTQDYITEKAVNESSTNYIPSNSLLMVVRSGILQRTIPVAINTIPVTLNQDMKAFRFNQLVSVGYIAQYIIGNTPQLLMDWSKDGATVESIEHEYLANSLLPVPPIEEQAEIVAFIYKKIEMFEKLQTFAEKQVKLLKERRTALISAAVTGKIDVRDVEFS